MIAILTGDIINSRKAASPQEWLSLLKDALGKNANWEIYRGDSFQVKVLPENAFIEAVYIKACLKTIKEIDARIAIGIGKEEYTGTKLSESNGEAYILSGEKLDTLKNERVNLAVSTPFADFDYELNIAIRLALIAMDKWSSITAETVKLAFEHPGISQQELASLSKRSQSSVSEALKRASFFEILELNSLYQKKIKAAILSL